MNEKRRNVLIICPFFRPNIGGVETRLDDICDELDKRGYSVTVLTYQPIITKAKGLPVEKKGNVTIYRFCWVGFDLFHKLKPYPMLQISYLCPVLFLRSLLFLAKNRRNIDVVHTAGFGASLIGRILKDIFKKRWVVSTHAIYEFKKGSLLANLIRWILARADVVLTLSEPSRRELIDIGVEAKKLVNQITWVDQDVFKPMDKEACRARLEYKNDFIVLFIGRLLAIKGIKDLVSAADETPFIDYVFVGSGVLEDFLMKKAAKAPNIYFAGSIPNKNLPVYYNAADVFIMPSQYKEGLGRVVIEALSCGVPVISSNLGGLAEILDKSVSILIDPLKENIKSAILGLYNDREKLTEMKKGARLFAEKVFSSNNAEAIISAYRGQI